MHDIIVYSQCRMWIFATAFVCVFRCKGVSRRSWTVRWGGTGPPSSVTEAVYPTWRPPSGRCCGSALWPLCSSLTWPSVIPGTLNSAMTLIQGPCTENYKPADIKSERTTVCLYSSPQHRGLLSKERNSSHHQPVGSAP